MHIKKTCMYIAYEHFWLTFIQGCSQWVNVASVFVSQIQNFIDSTNVTQTICLVSYIEFILFASPSKIILIASYLINIEIRNCCRKDLGLNLKFSLNLINLQTNWVFFDLIPFYLMSIEVFISCRKIQGLSIKSDCLI